MTDTATVRKPLTADRLHEMGACREALETFAAEWPDGAAWTAASIRRAAEIGLDLDWFAQNCLPAAARAACERTRAAAYAACEQARAAAWAACEQATAAARAAYEQARAPAWDAYERATAAALIGALGLE